MDAYRTNRYSGLAPEKHTHKATGGHTRAEGDIMTGITDQRPIVDDRYAYAGRRETEYTDRKPMDMDYPMTVRSKY